MDDCQPYLRALEYDGILQPVATILITDSPDELIATVTVLTLSVQLVRGSIGYAIYFNVLQNKLSNILPGNVGTAVAKAGLPWNQIPAIFGALFWGNRSALGGSATAILVAAEEWTKEPYVAGFKIIDLVSIAFCGSAVIACLFLDDIKKYKVDRVTVDIH